MTHVVNHNQQLSLYVFSRNEVWQKGTLFHVLFKKHNYFWLKSKYRHLEQDTDTKEFTFHAVMMEREKWPQLTNAQLAANALLHRCSSLPPPHV